MPYARLGLLIGSLHNEAGRYDRAIAALDRGLVVEPYDPNLAGEKAYTLVHIGRSGEAAAFCADAIAAVNPAEKLLVASLHRMRGLALGEMGRFDDAIAEYRASQALDPAETASANEILYLEGRKAGRGPSRERMTTMDQIRKPQA
jgi:tetratricopeptide (TPR) repeat protein